MSVLQKFIECGNRFYCPYCGKELKRKEDFEDYQIYNYYFCDCKDAKKEREIMRKIRELERQLPEVKYEKKPAIVEKEK